MKQNYLLRTLFQSLLLGLSFLTYAQDGGLRREITLTTPGTLSSQITESEYASLVELTLKGDINHHDIRFIQSRLKVLEALDISETKIQESERALGSGTFYPEDVLFDYALQEMPKLQRVKLPMSIKEVGMKAFYNDIALVEIDIPESVTFLRGYAFAFCKSLKKAIIPGTVQKVENYVFLSCESLSDVTLGEGMTMLGGDMFNGCKSLTKITLPSTLKEIGHQSFKGCTELTELTIPASCTTVGVQILRECPKMRLITCLAKVAPEASQKSFCPEQFGQIELRIPSEALLSYQDSPIWSMFENICDLSGRPLSSVVLQQRPTPKALWRDGYLQIAPVTGLPISVYDMSGRLILQETPSTDIVCYPLPQGGYLVQTPQGVQTVL